jgi:hypothetical protein
MRSRPISETLFEQLCSRYGVPCTPIACSHGQTPDFEIHLSGTRVICEVKQIDPNREDIEESMPIDPDTSVGRLVPNRLRGKLKKDVSPQLKASASCGCPTLLIVYDNTQFKMYSNHDDVVQAMFGLHSITVKFPTESTGDPIISKRFFGGNRGLTPTHNTSLSALGILDGGPSSELSLRVYHNPYAAVILRSELLTALHAEQWPIP